MSHDENVTDPETPTLAWGVPLYPNRYVWLVFMSAMDVFMTYVILRFDGREVNGVANWILNRFDIAGMAIYKFVLVTIVILIIEFVGRRKERLGRRMAEWAIAITCVPVTLAFVMLIVHQFGG